jgi:ParB family chromosome partitioning protein
MDQNKHTDNQPQLIDLSKLEPSPLNVRRTGKRDVLEELKASILSHGLMQNLVVTPNGGARYHVIAGGRRLEALRALLDERKLPEGYQVPCQVVTEDRARELSLAENKVRLAMHPADEFEAFAELVEKGATAGEVAERFGVSQRHVMQRLKLGKLAPELIKEYRAENLSLEVLEAFTLTDDRKRQMAVYRSLQGWQKDNAGHIRRCLSDKMVEADGKLAKFVGLDAYEAAGGKTRSDLFGEEVYLEDPELLNRLAGEKLDGIKRELESQGWGWVETVLDDDYSFTAQFVRLRPTPLDPPADLMAEKEALEKERDELYEAQESDDEGYESNDRLDGIEARLDEIQDLLADCVAFDPEEMKSAGSYVSVDYDGKVRIVRGLVKKEDKKKAAKEKKHEKTTGSGEKVSQTLLHDLAAYRQQAAQAEIAKNPALAFDLLVYQVASETLDSGFVFHGPNVKFTPNALRPTIETRTAALEEIERELPQGWRKAKTAKERFNLLRGMNMDDKTQLLAYALALTLEPKLGGDKEPSAYDMALSMTGGNVAEYWRPTKENYLSRISREQLIFLGEEIFGTDWKLKRNGYKKGQLVDELDAAFRDPDKHGKTDGEKERLKNWLPSGMAFGLTVKEPKKKKRTKKTA